MTDIKSYMGVIRIPEMVDFLGNLDDSQLAALDRELTELNQRGKLDGYEPMPLPKDGVWVNRPFELGLWGAHNAMNCRDEFSRQLVLRIISPDNQSASFDWTDYEVTFFVASRRRVKEAVTAFEVTLGADSISNVVVASQLILERGARVAKAFVDGTLLLGVGADIDELVVTDMTEIKGEGAAAFLTQLYIPLVRVTVVDFYVLANMEVN